MNGDTQREARQRALVEHALRDFRRGALTLRSLIQELQALTSELRLPRKDWIAAFQTEVNELEALYAIALDRGVADDLPVDYRADVNAAVNNLGSLIEELPRVSDGET